LLAGTGAGAFDQLPIGANGYLLTADSAEVTGIKWAAAPVSLPSQTGNAGEFLTTDGTTASWSAVATPVAQTTEPSSPTDGLIWVDTDGTAPTTVVTRWSKAPTAGTTTLTGTDDGTTVLAYTPGYEEVFLNGVLLSRTNDYTASTGTSVVLSAATITGDIVEVICPLQVAYTDAITTTAANAAYVPKTLTTTKGDIITATAANTPARLGVGSDAQILVADSSTATGLKWATPAGGGKVLQVVYGSTGTAAASSSSTQAATNLTASITPSSATSKVLVLVAQTGLAKNSANTGSAINLYLYRGATQLDMFQNSAAHTNSAVRNDVGGVSCNYLDTPATTSSTTYSTKFSSTNGTSEVYVQNGGGISTIVLMEIGA
jgi:hypothetical protein